MCRTGKNGHIPGDVTDGVGEEDEEVSFGSDQSTPESSGPPSLVTMSPSSPSRTPSSSEEDGSLEDGQDSNILQLVRDCLQLWRNWQMEEQELARLSFIDLDIFK